MTKLYISFAVILFSTVIAFGAPGNDSSDRVIGLNIYHSSTGSGYGSNLSLNIGIEKERRVLEAGILFQHITSEISGGEVLYKHYLSPLRESSEEGNGRLRNIRFYMQYNFIFRHSTLPGSHHLISDISGEELISEGRVATYEHYLGVGMQVLLVDNISLNTSLGYGAVLGSIDEEFMDQEHYTEGGRKNDLGPTMKFGIGYAFLK